MGAVVAGVARVAVAARAADLTGVGVEAVDGLVSGITLGEALGTGSGASIATLVALDLLGLVSAGVATGEALTRQRHEDQAALDGRLVRRQVGG